MEESDRRNWTLTLNYNMTTISPALISEFGNETELTFPHQNLTDIVNNTNNSHVTSVTQTMHDYSPGDIVWVLIATALVWLMVPGVGYFYSGMAQSKHSLSLIMLSCWSIAIVSIQWFLFGYSLTFSKTGSLFIGNFDHVFLSNTLASPSVASEKIPELVFCIYQAMFAAITPALAIGAAAERGRFLPTIIFIFFWTTFVYDFIACWTWNPNGWSNVLGGLDFAGGTPVHISSGAAALAYAVILGHRELEDGASTSSRVPPNMGNVVLGTSFIWFGWFGFNGGSALAGNLRAAMACVVTNLAASTGGITWVLMDYRYDGKFSPSGFCAGAVAGLVCITPGSGFVGPAASIAFGFFGAVVCNLALNLKLYLKFDDALDVFALHGVGGIVGNILTGIFAQKSIAALDGTVISGGWVNGNWIQMAYQVADSVAGFTWSFVVTYIILYIMNRIPGLNLRAAADVERSGLDQAEFGVSCYEYTNDFKGSYKSFIDPQMLSCCGPEKVASINGYIMTGVKRNSVNSDEEMIYPHSPVEGIGQNSESEINPNDRLKGKQKVDETVKAHEYFLPSQVSFHDVSL